LTAPKQFFEKLHTLYGIDRAWRFTEFEKKLIFFYLFLTTNITNF